MHLAASSHDDNHFRQQDMVSFVAAEGHWVSVACPSKEWAMAGSVLSLGRALNDDCNALAASNAS